MRNLRWQHWVLIGAFASIAYVLVMIFFMAMRPD